MQIAHWLVYIYILAGNTDQFIYRKGNEKITKLLINKRGKVNYVCITPLSAPDPHLSPASPIKISYRNG